MENIKQEKPQRHKATSIARTLIESSGKDRQQFDEEFKQWLKDKAKKGATAHA